MFSSITKLTIFCIFLALVAFLDFEIYQVNIVAVYLQKKLDEEIYIKIPERVEKLDSKGYY